MIRKLLLLTMVIPAMGIAQNCKQSQEIQAKLLASQTPVTATSQSVERILGCGTVDLPYMEDFNSVTVPNIPSCTSIENAGTGNDFTTATNPGYGFTTNTLRYKWSVPSAANAWFFTPGLNLTAGQTYTISYRYGSAGSTAFTEKLKVHVGDTPSSAFMSPEPLIDHPLVNNNVTPITDNLTFTPDASGAYYFGFNCYSNADQFYLFIDDISVTPNLATTKFDAISVNYYPNPVNDVLTIDAGRKIDSVILYTILGQTVSNSAIGSEKAHVDMQSLPSGNYLVKVVSGKAEKTFKVTKN